MYDVFVKLLNRGLAAGVLVLVIVLLRVLLKKAPRRIVCLLWALVALRLVLPFGIQSDLSAFNLMRSTVGDRGQLEYFRYNEKTEKPKAEFSVPALVNDDYSPDSMTVGEKTSDFYLPPVVHIWLAGMGVLLLCALVGYLRLKRRVRASIPIEKGVMACDEVKSPFILGVIRPVVYVPSGMDGETLSQVLSHERAHIRRRDHWWKPLGYLLLTVYWFDPALWLGYVLLCRDMETACDERVIRDMSREDRAAYSQALLDCSFPRRMITACPVAFGEVGVKTRVRSVLHYKKPAFWLVLLAALLSIAAAVCLMTDPRTEDHLRFVPRSSALGQHADFEVHFGRETQSALVTVELWENGACTYGEPVVITKETKRLSVLFSDRRENGSISGENVQIDTDTVTAASLSYFPFPKEMTGWAFSSWQDRKTIPAPVGEELILAAMTCDFGSGVVSYDCRTLTEEPERMKNAACMIVVRAQFCEGLAEAPAMTDAHPSDIAGTYLCEKPGFGGAFTVTLHEDGTFTYYEGMLSSYIGVGTWEYTDDRVVLTDTTFEEPRRTVFAYENDTLTFDREHSVRFIYTDLEDGTKFSRRPELPIDTVTQTETVIVSAGREHVIPVLSFAYSAEWTENGFLCADGGPLELARKDIPTLRYADDLRVSLRDGVSLRQITVYDGNYELLDSLRELSELSELKPGDYLVCLTVCELGDYIEEAGESEYTGRNAVFRMTKD